MAEEVPVILVVGSNLAFFCFNIIEVGFTCISQRTYYICNLVEGGGGIDRRSPINTKL
jgi:hypothetical protein